MILQGTTTHVVRVVRVARAVAFGGRQPPKGFGVEGEWGERGEGWPPFFVFSKKKHRNIRVARVVKVVRVVGWWLPQYQHMCVSLPQGGQRKTHLGRSWGAHGGGGGGGRVRKEAHRAGQLGWEAQLSCWGAVGPLMGWSGALLGRRGRVEGGFRSRPLFSS